MTASNLVLVALAFIVGALAWLYWNDQRAFPVALEICGVTDGHCFETARYTDWQGCQRAVEKGNWLCDQTTDPQKITCRPAADSVAEGRCVYR